MCGIFGLIISKDHGFDQSNWLKALDNLFILSETRGKEAAGIAVATPNKIRVHKDSVSASMMLKTAEYRNLTNQVASEYFDKASKETLSTIGHSRLVTNGLQGIDANNQPVWRDKSVIVHNGIVVNVDELWETTDGISPRAEVDSEVVAALIEKYRTEGMTPAKAVSKTFSQIYGETSIAMLFSDLNLMVLATNTGSIYLADDAEGTGTVFVSERYICEQLTSGENLIPQFAGRPCRQIPAGEGMLINLETLEAETFALEGKLSTPELAPLLATQRKIEEKSDTLRKARENMKRCTKCLMPETMPYINFDNDGVCNFCHSYEPQVLKDEEELMKSFDAIRSKDGTPDCLMAFSGGRDSSYGLHLLKTKYNMNPMAYTYDWGMVTDLARRNQSRLCGKLGVEHIWVSADIKKKRANVRRNVEAWLKKPDLGLIPLFMAGDKQVLWHANRIMKETSLPTMVFCTNHYEKTEFKTGFLNTASNSSTIHKPSSLSLSSKTNMLWQYGKRFLANPAYFNRSMPDTLGAYFSYYVIEQNYVSLLDYLPWDEEETDKILIGEYEWETAHDSENTWRIGDATAPFYNYIYYTVAGFTENETFRSNQIREGVIDRETAMKLVDRDNQPRWDSIREYTQIINTDFDEVVRVIDRIPRLYAS